MLAILSPAKTLDLSPSRGVGRKTRPAFLEEAGELVEVARRLSPADLQALMGVSEALAELNHERFQRWEVPYPKGEAKQALLLFRGDVYQGFELEKYEKEDWAYAQDHLRILSGLYGLLRPLDEILPYRLEMGTRLRTERGRDLYGFWGDQLAKALNKALAKQGDDVLVNLASQEYFKAVRPKALRARVVTPVFKDVKGGKLKVISFYAKRARGMLADYMIRQRLTRVEELRGFAEAGYGYDASLSDADTLVFTRAER